MPDRKMFWRIVRRLFAAQRGRLLVVLLALGAGAALTAALLNLEVDARSRLTKEFRAFGTNVVVAPRASSSSSSPTLLDEVVAKRVREFPNPRVISAASNLYLVADVSSSAVTHPIQAVIAGKRMEVQTTRIVIRREGQPVAAPQDEKFCVVGPKAGELLHVQQQDHLTLRSSGREEACESFLSSFRGDESDNQIEIDLATAQRLANLPGKISLMQISVAGTPREIREYIGGLAQNIPDADVHGLRQFTDAEAKIYNRITGLLTATTALVLALTGLCVMAAMSNVAMERKNDVGLMKAIGGATRRVMRLFLAEAAVLGLAGGVVGGALGLMLSIWLGKTVFGVAARPRLIVYPVAVVLTILVAIVSAYPLRRLANISPASVFRGEA
jgi:putative ABC transport system permease protein